LIVFVRVTLERSYASDPDYLHSVGSSIRAPGFSGDDIYLSSPGDRQHIVFGELLREDTGVQSDNLQPGPDVAVSHFVRPSPVSGAFPRSLQVLVASRTAAGLSWSGVKT